MTIGLLKIDDKEWKKAEAFFKDKKNKAKTKMSKQEGEHSFIKIPGPNPGEYQIFAMASRHYAGEENHARLGEGAFGKVKVVQNKKGENFAVKIEGRGLRGEKDVETQITKLLKFTIGEVARKLPSAKTFKDKETRIKLYTVMQLREGKELTKYIYHPTIDPKVHGERIEDQSKLTDTQKLITALKICKAVQALHDKGIIHADLKPANLMADIDGNQIVVNSIDFGASLMFKPGEMIGSIKRGTEKYRAPELDSGGFNSFASDIYALGTIFQDDMQLDKDIWEGMLKNQNERVDMYTVMSKITEKLDKVSDLDANTKAYVSEIKNEIHENDALNTKLNEIFMKYNDFDKINSVYGNTPRNWKSTAKEVSHFFSNKKTTRNDQMANLSFMFQGLQDNNKMSANERAKLAIGTLSKLRKDIKKETKLFDSSLDKVCEQLITEIKKEIKNTLGQDMLSKWNLTQEQPKPTSKSKFLLK